MALVICKECGAEISSNAFSCPKCGSSTINRAIKTAAKISLAFWGSIFGLFALLAVIGAIIRSNEPLEKTVSIEEIDNPFTRDNFGDNWPFKVDALEMKCMRKRRGDTWSYVAYADGKYYSLNSSAKVWYYHPYPDQIIDSNGFNNLRKLEVSKSTWKKYEPFAGLLTITDVEYTIGRSPLGEAIDDFCGDWQ